MDQLFSTGLDPITQGEKAFFKAMGVSQQTGASWEVGRRGVPVSVSVLPLLARTLGVAVETLVGETGRPSAERGRPSFSSKSSA